MPNIRILAKAVLEIFCSQGCSSTKYLCPKMGNNSSEKIWNMFKSCSVHLNYGLFLYAKYQDPIQSSSLDILFTRLFLYKMVRYPVWPHTFVSPSAFSRRAVVSYWRKYVHEVLVNRLGGLSLPRKSVVRLTDRPDMTLDVYRGRKTTNQQQQQLYKMPVSENKSNSTKNLRNTFKS